MSAVKVAVHSTDPITQVGLIDHIKHDPTLAHTPVAQAEVTVVAAETADASTMELLRSLSASSNSRYVLIISGQWYADLLSAVECGVRALLWRSEFTNCTFSRAVHAVHEGKGDLPTTIQGMLLDQVERVQRDILSPRGLTASGLTSREIDVLRMASEGLELSEIANKLCYSERTIKNTLYGLMNRLGLRNRVHAVSFALRQGII